MREVMTKPNRNSKWKNVPKTLKADISQVKYILCEILYTYKFKQMVSTLGKSWQKIWICIPHISTSPLQRSAAVPFVKSHENKSQSFVDSIQGYDELNKYFKPISHSYEGHKGLKQL